MQRSITMQILVGLLLMTGCARHPAVHHAGKISDWAADAIWYQIFPDRFWNGDTTNDPTIATLEGTWPYEKQEAWSVMPWTADWYELQPWEKTNNQGFYYNAQLRRYGGDLQGILERLDYLEDLGVNAIYLNPVFESASAHKYGATMYHHIDNNFGPDPAGDEKIWAQEDPSDPGSWQWTAADRLFLELIREVHARGMHIIIDGVFNHVGIPFWAFQDLREKGEQSQYADWFVIESFDDPATAEDEFSYSGWYGIPDLPEIREDKQGPPDAFRDHIRAVVRRWMDPNGDGDPSDGVDGWRLDVADMVADDFWRDFRKWVYASNPRAYLTGEVWWEDFPNNIMLDAAPWLEGDIFDAVMNYRFADAMLKAFVDRDQQITPTELDRLLTDVRDGYPQRSKYVLMNLMGSHDTERLASMVANPDRWLDHACNLNYDKDFDVNKPDSAERQVQKLILAFQFCYVGSPYIFYGDEVGMWGADDPDCRKPMLWENLEYSDEKAHPFDMPKPVDTVAPDLQLRDYYRQLIHLRKTHPELRRGEYRTFLTDDKKLLFGFERCLGERKIRAIFNASDTHQLLDINALLDGAPDHWVHVFGTIPRQNELPSKSCAIYRKR